MRPKTRGHYRMELVGAARELLTEGKSIRECARLLGMSKTTVSKISRALKQPRFCPCGKPAGHKGWCPHRFRQSFPRRGFMALWRRIDPMKAPTFLHRLRDTGIAECATRGDCFDFTLASSVRSGGAVRCVGCNESIPRGHYYLRIGKQTGHRYSQRHFCWSCCHEEAVYRELDDHNIFIRDERGVLLYRDDSGRNRHRAVSGEELEFHRLTRLLDRFRVRSQTYRTPEAARRAFYKWVARRQLYGKLAYRESPWAGIKGWWARGMAKRHFGTPPRYGIPIYGWHRSEPMRQWEMEFDKHREQWAARRSELLQTRRKGIERRALVENRKNRARMRMLAGFSQLTQITHEH